MNLHRGGNIWDQVERAEIARYAKGLGDPEKAGAYSLENLQRRHKRPNGPLTARFEVGSAGVS